MNTGKELLFFFSALGTFNGLILSLYFLAFTKKKYLTNYLLGGLILALSMRIGKSVFAYFDPTLPKIYLQIGLSACFFIGPFLYLFLKAATSGAQQMTKKWSILLYLLLAIVLITGTIFPYQNYPGLWNNYFAQAIYIQWFLFVVAAGFPMKKHLMKLFTRAEKMAAQETWLLLIYTCNVIIYIFYFLALIRAPFTSYINGSIVFSFMLYLAITILLYRKKTDDLFLFTTEKALGKKMDPLFIDQLMAKLEKAMSIDKAYKDPDLKLVTLAKKIGVSAHQLSELLNDHLANNFTTYVNGYRIEEACTIITTNHKLTLESIGYEVGFNSKSTFFAAFKKHIGTTPLSYQQQMAIATSTDL